MSVSIHEQSYVFARGITTLAATSTSYGITMKDIIGWCFSRFPIDVDLCEACSGA